MLKAILRVLGVRIDTNVSPPQTPKPVGCSGGLDILQNEPLLEELAITRYPPFDQGIPVIAVDKVLKSQQELIERIFRTAGVSRADFEMQYLPPIRNLAVYVHLLPATSTTYFRGTGGLFRMSLEVALNSLQSANAAVFPDGGGVERRFSMQPRWTLATFLAGLCSQNYRTVNSMAVLTRDNQQWTPLLSPLMQWCDLVKTDVYFVRWMEEIRVHGAQASSAFLVSQIVPGDVLQYLASDNNQVVPSMTAAIAGVETNMSGNPIGRLVAPVITRVIEDDLKRSATNYGHLVIGAHLEMHLVDAMRRLMKGGKWMVNNSTSGGRLWVGQEGVFVDWVPASKDIANLLTRDSFAGIPQDPDTLADLLVSASMLQAGKNGARYWSIILPGTFEARDGMVKLKDGKMLFPSGFDFDPYKNTQLLATKAFAVESKGGSGKSSNNQLRIEEFDHANSGHVEDEGVAGVTTARRRSEPVVQPTGQGDVKQGGSARSKKKVEKAQPPVEGADRTDSAEVPHQVPASDVETTTSKMLGALTPANAWLMSEVLQSFKSNPGSDAVISLPYGVGIDHDELQRHGLPVMDLLEDLALKAWLWTDKTRMARRVHPTEINGATRRLVILKTDIAAGLGFISEGR